MAGFTSRGWPGRPLCCGFIWWLRRTGRADPTHSPTWDQGEDEPHPAPHPRFALSAPVEPQLSSQRECRGNPKSQRPPTRGRMTARAQRGALCCSRTASAGSSPACRARGPHQAQQVWPWELRRAAWAWGGDAFDSPGGSPGARGPSPTGRAWAARHFLWAWGLRKGTRSGGLSW